MIAHRLSDPVGVLNYVIVMQFLDRKLKRKKEKTKSCKESRINNNNRKYSPTRIAAIAGICSTVGCVCVFTCSCSFRAMAPHSPGHTRTPPHSCYSDRYTVVHSTHTHTPSWLCVSGMCGFTYKHSFFLLFFAFFFNFSMCVKITVIPVRRINKKKKGEYPSRG